VALRRAIAVFALAAALAAAWGARAQVSEAELKAAFVYNFALFTEWPRDVLGDDQNLLVCAKLDDRQLDALRRLQGRTVAGHTIAVSAAAGDAGRCHVVLYDPDAHIPPAAEATAGALTVCDGPRYACADAVITLLREGDRIRFDVDAGRARAQRLSLSSKLLRLARRVQ
jgi:hypothetical protein